MRRTATPRSASSSFLLLISLLGLFYPLVSRAQSGSQGQVADSTELRVLRQFYYSTGGAQWTNHTGWPATPTAWTQATLAAAAGWAGVQVQAGDVTALGLPLNHLTGALPASLGLLGGLLDLQLWQNQLTGPIPPSLGQLTNLRALALQQNQLSGPVPPELGQLPQLESLALGVNQLSGPLPASLAQLPRLLTLWLDNNRLSGPIPAALGQLSQLQLLNLSVNQLSGPLPASLAQLTRLNQCDLSRNQFSGELTGLVDQWTNLQSLDLSHNRFTGPVPAALGALPRLAGFGAEDNQLTGPLPAALGNASALWSLNLSNNQLTGPIPGSWGRLNVRQLFLSTNRLSGPLSDSLASLRPNVFDVDHNQLRGPVPAWLTQWGFPYRLNLTANRFAGALPSHLQANFLLLSDNQLTGALPADYGETPCWQLLLDNNQLTRIPKFTQPLGYPNLQLGLTGNYLQFDSYEPSQRTPGQYQFWDYGQRPRPGDTTYAVAGTSVTLNGRIAGAHNVYQWQRLISGQWVNMPGDTLPTRRWEQVSPLTSGSYRTVVTNRWVPAVVLCSPTRVLDVTPYPPLARNLPVDSNGVPTLQNAPVAADAQAARLTPDLNYVRVWTPRVALTDAATGPTRPPGSRREEWAQVPNGGTPAIPVTTPPTLVTQLPSLEATSTTRFNYGARLRAWLVPPVTGPYTLYLSATHAGKLYLSTSSSPADTVRLATGAPFTTSVHNYTSVPQQAGTVTLQAGQAYYLEVQHQHQWGPGYVSVGWQLPGGPLPTGPIPGQYLRPLVPGEGGPAAVTWSVDQAAMSTQYLDGLGRPLQTVSWQASPTKHDLVQVQHYDGLGREPRQYLPYVADSTSGGFRPRGLTEQGRYYGQLPATGPPSPTDLTQNVARTGVAFAETLFEASPLNRVLAQAAPGEAAQLTGGHHVERLERPNVFADSVLRFQPSYDPRDLDPHCQGSYAPGDLWGVFTRDEHGFWSAEWKDKLGQVVSKQVQTQPPGQGTGAPRRWLRTLYAYDDFQHLRFVLQPEASRRLLAAVAALAPAPPPPGVRLQRWSNVNGTQLSDIPLTQPPTSSRVLPQFETVTASSNEDFHYGARLQAWLLPPQDGDYTFFLTGNDVAQAWLSLDGDPAHKQALNFSSIYTKGPRDYTPNAEQRSAPVRLRTDRVYYLEVQLKQEWDKAYASLSWQLPDGTPQQPSQPISGQYLVPYDETQPPPPAPGSVPLPAASLPATAAPFVFHYRYDGRGRQVAKQVPGQDGETLVVYDQLDRPVLSQDAQQRTRREWSWSKYDALGRIVLTGLVTRPDTLGQVSLQSMAATDTATVHQYEQRTADKVTYPQFYTTRQAFPRLGTAGQQGFSEGLVLTASYFDDYDFDNDGQPDAQYDPSQDGQFASGQAPVADALRTTGLATGARTRVLGVAESDPQQAAWLTTASFYDERGRVVQVQSTNARQGTDLVTSQLDFTGKVVQSVASHQGPRHAPLVVKESFVYDHAGRVLASFQQLPGEARPALLDSLHYNELGQLTRKTLGTGRLRQDVDYAYNVRGWLTSLNNPYAPDPKDLFNLSLHYEQGFTPGYEQYNGNLTGQTWRGHDGVQRAQGYVYDPLNRLLQGDFVARTGGASPSQGAWTQELDNYRLSFVSYDDNGNIQTLRRRGLLQQATSRVAKQYGAVDNLSYAYQGNRLQAVNDLVSGNQLPQPASYHGAPTSLAGDFQEGGVQQAQEYGYDANGNLTSDQNKGITGILYNHLNLPRQIHFGQGADSVVFRYAASGQKVAKLVYQTGQAQPLRTDYLGPYQYERDSLQFFPHAEGRVLRFVSYDAANQPTVRYQREYTLKDHLGNLRLAYRAGQVRTLTATLEQDSATHRRERQQFDVASVSPPVAVATGLAHSGTWAARLNAGGSAPQPLGPLTQLGVQQGDTVTVTAHGMYEQPTQHGFFFSLGAFLAAIFHPASPPPTGLEVSRRKDLPLLQVGVAAGLSSLPQLSGGVPKGYLRLLVFNRDSVLVSQQVTQLTQADRGGYQPQPLRLQVVLPQDGYVTAYVGNESDVDVFFDDIKVEHRQGLQVQENQYEPWGLSLAGIDYSSPGIQGLNKYQYNSKELQADLGLNLSDYGARLYDAQLGRWHNVDPLANLMRRHSPYNYGFDNPLRFVDHDGMGPGEGDNKPPSDSFWDRFKNWAGNLFSSQQGLGRDREVADPDVKVMFERMGQEALAKGDELQTPLGIMKEMADLYTLSIFIPGEEGGSLGTYDEALGETATVAAPVEEAAVASTKLVSTADTEIRAGARAVAGQAFPDGSAPFIRTSAPPMTPGVNLSREMEDAYKPFGGVGAQVYVPGREKPIIVGTCAEQHAANDLFLARPGSGYTARQLIGTGAYTPKGSFKPVPRCYVCEQIFGPNLFPPKK